MPASPEPIQLAVISSFFSPEWLGKPEARSASTPWGDTSVDLAKVEGWTVACVWRYGRDLALPSHRINYRANLWVPRTLGSERVISQNAIGSANPALPPGAAVVSDDFIDFTHTRPKTFFDADDLWVRVDMPEPSCAEVRAALLAGGEGLFEQLQDGGVFLCAEGPRFESAAEIRMFRQ